MRSNFSTVAAGMGDRNEFRPSEAAPQLVSVKPAGTIDSDGTRPLGAEAGSELPEIAYPRRLQGSEQELKTTGGGTAGTAGPAAETQFDRVVDHPASGSARAAAKPGRSIRERLRRSSG